MRNLASKSLLESQIMRTGVRSGLLWLAPIAVPLAFGDAASDNPATSAKQHTKSWSVEELMPPQDPWLHSNGTNGTWTTTRDVFVRVTQAQNGGNTALIQFHDRQGRISMEDQRLRLVTLKGIQHTQFLEQVAMRQYMLNQLGRALGDHVREQSELLQTISRGLTFDTRSGFNASSSMQSSGTPVRYGLVLKNVEPSGQGVHVAALTMDDRYMEQILSGESQAKVNWTIGPLAEDSERKLFENALLNHTSAQAPTMSTGIWNFKPDFSLRGKVEPNFQGNAQNLTGLRLKVEQPQGLYRMEMLTGGPVSQMAQEVALPLYGELRLTRQMDGNFNVSRTSLVNVLGFSDSLRLFPVNVHYAHADSSIKAESSFNAWAGRIGLESYVAGPAGTASGPLCTVSYTRSL